MSVIKVNKITSVNGLDSVEVDTHLKLKEQSAAPTEINMMFTNVENNGAPWKFPATDRLKWKDE